jgi:hypothetical protein
VPVYLFGKLFVGLAQIADRRPRMSFLTDEVSVATFTAIAGQTCCRRRCCDDAFVVRRGGQGTLEVAAVVGSPYRRAN